MPGKSTPLTTKLYPSRRQFFQWYFVEDLTIPKVKEKMDELTRDLRSAGHNYDFVAKGSEWANRSRHWMVGWKVSKNPKRQNLSMPAELANLTYWIDNDRDVGDWRKQESSDENYFTSTEPQAHEHQNTSHWDGAHQDSALTDSGALEQFNAPLPPPMSTNMIPHSSDNTRYATFPLGDAENMSSSQQSANPVADMPLIWSVQPEQAPGALQQYNPTPLWSQPEQVPGALQQYRYNPNAYSQNSQMATTAPGVNLSLANSAHRNNQAFARPMSEIEWSQTSFDSWSLDNSGPAVQPQGRSFLQNDYSQHASNPGVHGQHQPRGFAAGQSLGPRGTPWNPNHQHDPASQ